MEQVRKVPWWHTALRASYWISFLVMMGLIAFADPYSWTHGIPAILLGATVLALELFVETRQRKIIALFLKLSGIGLVACGVWVILAYGNLL